jgi:hypothetical protein
MSVTLITFYCCSLDMKSIQEVCQNTLHDFNLCMFSQPSGTASAGTSSSPTRLDASPATSRATDEKPGYLSDEIVFKIIVICLAMIHVMQKDGRYLVLTFCQQYL